MDAQDAMRLTEKAAALMEQFERRSRELEQRQQTLAQQVPVLLKQSADAVLQGVPREVQTKVQAALEHVMHDYEQRMREAGDRAQALGQQIERMERVHRHVIWKVASIAVCALLALGLGGAALSKHYYDKIEENRVSAELLQLYNRADVVPCGEQLCANVDVKGQRYGDKNRQYLPVKPHG
jgi:hypothetical protein